MLERILKLREIEDDSLFLWGSRQTGKSTLLKALFPKARLYDLLKTDVRMAFQLRPALNSHGDRHLGMGACFHGNFFAIFLMVS